MSQHFPKVFLSGAGGNVGQAILQSAKNQGRAQQFVAGFRDPYQAQVPTGVTTIAFDFLNPSTFTGALRGCSVLFLVRPPQISEAKVFKPLLEYARQEGIKHIIFLSVQGAENNRFIPHYKIEKLIKASGIGYTFLRPAYFMENFLGEHRHEILAKNRVYMPAGKARFTLVSVEDIAKAALEVIKNIDKFKAQGLTLTNGQQLTFAQMCEIIAEARGRPINFISPHLLQFFLYQRKQGTPMAFILVKIMLHYLPRFSAAPKADETLHQILNQAPLTFRDFAQKHKNAWLNS